MTTDELKRCIQDHPKNQSQIGAEIGFSRSKMSRLTTGQSIDEADSKLLRLYFYGEIPFEMVRETPDLSSVLRLSQAEWQIISIISKREGFISEAAWIGAKVRGYLENNEQALSLAKSSRAGRNVRDAGIALVNEETTPYGAKVIDPAMDAINEANANGGEDSTTASA